MHVHAPLIRTTRASSCTKFHKHGPVAGSKPEDVQLSATPLRFCWLLACAEFAGPAAMHHQNGIAAVGPSTMLLEVLRLAEALAALAALDLPGRLSGLCSVGETPRALRPCADVEPRVPCKANDNLRLAKAISAQGYYLCSLLRNKLLARFLPVPECTSPQIRPPCTEKDLCDPRIRQYQAVEPHPQIRHMPYHGHRVDSTLAGSW